MWNWKPRWLNSKFTRGSFQFVCPFSTNHLECPDIDITDTFRGGSLVSHPNPKAVVKLVQKADESSGSKMKGSAFSQRSALQSIAGEYQSWTSLHISSYFMRCTAWAGEFNPKATELRPKGHRHQNISSTKIEVLFYGVSRRLTHPQSPLGRRHPYPEFQPLLEVEVNLEQTRTTIQPMPCRGIPSAQARQDSQCASHVLMDRAVTSES